MCAERVNHTSSRLLPSAQRSVGPSDRNVPAGIAECRGHNSYYSPWWRTSVPKKHLFDSGARPWCNGAMGVSGPRRKPLNTGHVLKILEQFAEAVKRDRIPHQVLRAYSPDCENDRILITIYPDDPYFRQNVAKLLPDGSFTIRVEAVSARAL